MPRNLIHAKAIADHRGVIASPGAILLEGDCIIQSGSPQEIGTPDDATLTQIDTVITPTFVNTHAHLDLSGVGITPSESSLSEWIEAVVFPIRNNSNAVQPAVHRGVELVQLGGTSLIGDISGSMEAAQIVQNSKLRSQMYIELLGTGERQQATVEQIRVLPDGYGVEPHAPYSCGLDVFREAFASGRPLAMHLAESIEEIEYAKNRTGKTADFIKRIGAWDAKDVAWGCHPIDKVLEIAKDTPFIAAHLNYIEDRHLPMLAASNITVAYCPRASEYFGHTNHRWKEMLHAGVTVALGTDSLLCLDTPDRISIIDEMRRLYTQHHADPVQLLTMATINGAKGLGLDPNLVTLNAGETAGLLAFESSGNDPLFDIFNATTMPTWL